MMGRLPQTSRKPLKHMSRQYLMHMAETCVLQPSGEPHLWMQRTNQIVLIGAGAGVCQPRRRRSLSAVQRDRHAVTGK